MNGQERRLLDDLLLLVDAVAEMPDDADLEELEPGDVNAESEATVDWLMSQLGTAAATPARTDAQPNFDDQFAAIVRANLTDLSDNLVLARGRGAQVPTQDLVVAQLIEFGYDSRVELEIDVAANGQDLTLTLLLNRVENHAPNLRVFASAATGVTVQAKVTEAGMAVLNGLSAEDAATLVLTFVQD